MKAWPKFMAPPLFVDFETYREGKYSLRSMTTAEYIADDRFFVQAMAYWDPVEKRKGVLFHDEDISGFLDEIDTHRRTLVCHNTQFDGKIMSEHYGLEFRAYVCTLTMARGVLRHLVPGFSLDAIFEHYTGRKLKDDTLGEMEGIREVPEEMRAKYGTYALNDVKGMIFILSKMIEEYPDTQWWHMDWAIRKFVHADMVIDEEACEVFLQEYDAESAEICARWGAEPKEFTSAAKFATLLALKGRMWDPIKELGNLNGPRVPTVVNKNGDTRYDMSKKSEKFIVNVLESERPSIRELGAARVRFASSAERKMGEDLIRVSRATKKFALGVNSSGTATHRLSGSSDLCGINVLAMKRGSTLRRALRAKAGYKMLSLDMSAFELGICRFLAQDVSAMAILTSRTADLYMDFARMAFRDPEMLREGNEDKRDIGKTSELQLQYNSGASTLRSQLLEKGVHITMQEAQRLVKVFRHSAHPELYAYWQTFGGYLSRMARNSNPIPVKNAPFLQVEPGGIRLPNDMMIRFPDLKQRQGDWSYQKTLGAGFTRDKIYGGKAMQYCCQSLANVIIQEKKRAVTRETGFDVCHEVYDDITTLLPLSAGQDAIDAITEIAVRPLTWWPELPLSCEWGVGGSWGDCKKDNKVYGPQIT